MNAIKFKVGMRVKYRSETFIQTLPKLYRELGIAQQAIDDYDISDFVITHISGNWYINGDERSRIVCIRSREHGEVYNTLAIFLVPHIPTIKEGDRL